MPTIDYDGRTERFRTWRTLPEDLLEAWRRALLEVLVPDGRDETAVSPALVLDLGSGTGQFLQPLREWFGATVVGVELGAAMRRSSIEAGVLGDRDPPIHLLGGRSEALPLRSSTVDLAWLSTVIHQFDDRPGALAELRRVLRPGGVVAMRGFFADVALSAPLRCFPGIERSVANFPTSATITTEATAAGFTGSTFRTVDEHLRIDAEALVARVEALRHTDSMFVPLTDDEIATGTDRLRAWAEAHGPGQHTYALGLLVLTTT